MFCPQFSCTKKRGKREGIFERPDTSTEVCVGTAKPRVNVEAHCRASHEDSGQTNRPKVQFAAEAGER